MATNLGGKSRPVAGTPPDQVEAALRASIGNPEIRPRPGTALPHPNPITQADNMLGDIIQWKQAGISESEMIMRMKRQYGINPPQAKLALSRVNDDWQSILRAEAPAPKGTPPGQVASKLRQSIAAAKAPKPQEALADELHNKVVDWRQQGLSKGQMVSSMRELYKIPKGTGSQMVDMVLKAYGVN